MFQVAHFEYRSQLTPQKTQTEKHIKIGILFILLIEFEKKQTNNFDKLFIHNSSGKTFSLKKGR